MTQERASPFSDTFEFTAPDASTVFEFEFVDPAANGFELKIRRTLVNGMDSVKDWHPHDADQVVV